MAVVPLECIRDGNTSHMPPPPAFISTRQHCQDDDNVAPAKEPHMGGQDIHGDSSETSREGSSSASDCESMTNENDDDNSGDDNSGDNNGDNSRDNNEDNNSGDNNGNNNDNRQQ